MFDQGQDDGTQPQDQQPVNPQPGQGDNGGEMPQEPPVTPGEDEGDDEDDQTPPAMPQQ